MISVGEIEKVREDMQKKIDYLKVLTEDYKRVVDECDPAGISSNSFMIAHQESLLEKYKDHFTIRQEEEIDDLKRQYVTQFQRLNIGKVCECKPKIK